MVIDQRGRPCSAEHLARTTLALLNAGQRGIRHASDGGECTWYEFAVEIARLTAPDCHIEPCSAAEFPRPAPTPADRLLALGPTAPGGYRYSDKFTARLRAHYFDVRLDEGSFTTSVLRFNASYSFAPHIYLQANVQYNDDTEDLGTNIRFGWLDTAGTGLFIVWNDTNHVGMFERTGILAGPKQRQLVIKYSRLLNLTR